VHIELVDALRCPASHDDTWLVASVTRFDGRDIVDGVLGCPVCHRQYAVRRGEVDFGGAEGGEPEALGDADASEMPDASRTPNADELLRARALLALGDVGGIVLLGGALARFAPHLADEVQVAPLLLNAPRSAWSPGGATSAIRAREALPIASGALRAAWLDASTANARVVAEAARALRAGGRLVAPASAAVPPVVHLLARDEEQWVGEAAGSPSTPVALQRR
jgi:hypothetical protein